jgi:altronate dehydratase small subunit
MGVESFYEGIGLSRRYIVVDERDNVATAIADILKGEAVEVKGKKVIIGENIRYGHKFAIKAIPRDGYVVKYGERIGRATAAIPAGSHVHVHNVEDIVDEVRKL